MTEVSEAPNPEQQMAEAISKRIREKNPVPPVPGEQAGHALTQESQTSSITDAILNSPRAKALRKQLAQQAQVQAPVEEIMPEEIIEDQKGPSFFARIGLALKNFFSRLFGRNKKEEFESQS